MDYKNVYTKDYFSGKNSFFYPFGYGKFSILYKLYFANSFRFLKPYVQKIKQGKVLDVGCAFGFMLEKFPKNFEKCGIDISEYAITQAKKRVPDALLQVASAEDPFPFPENSFDIITANDVLEHLENPRVALQNIHKALKPGGVFYLNTPNLNLLRKKVFAAADRKENHISLFPHDDLLALLQEVDFEVLNHWTYINTIFFFLRFRLNAGVESAFICKKS